MILNLPLAVKVGKKNCPLNLNFYRNAHYQTLNKMKVVFASMIQQSLEELPKFKHINLTYTLYPKTHRLCDVANICSIVDKFFCDALVGSQKLDDDNYTFLNQVTYQFGEIDKNNPRVTVEIKETKYADPDEPVRT